jgi:peroxidase
MLRITQHTRFLGTSRADEIDTLIEEDLRSHLSVSAGLPPTAVSIDLAALNIQRGRDHGLPDYNTMRSAVGLDKLKWVTACVQVMVAMVGINAPPFVQLTRCATLLSACVHPRDFANLTSSPALRDALQRVYGDISSVDPWVGGLAEPHV